MRFEGRFAGAVIKGQVGPERVGGVSVCLQGGSIRGSAGSLCLVPDAAQGSGSTGAPPAPSSQQLPGNSLRVLPANCMRVAKSPSASPV